MIPLPVLRYKLENLRERWEAPISARLFVDPASTEIVFLDADGARLLRAMGKNVERIFYKEKLPPRHHKEPGSISELPRFSIITGKDSSAPSTGRS